MNNSLLVSLVLIGAGVLALELGISSAITEVLAGILVGYLIADSHSMQWLQFLAHFGLLGLMFLAGFEVDIAHVRSRWKHSLGIGIVSLGMPFAGLFLFLSQITGLAPRPALLMAAGLSTTSLALVYHALEERGMLGDENGQTMLGAAMVVDVLSMVSLAGLLGDVGWATVLFLVFLIPAVMGLPRLGKWIFRRYRNTIVEFELRFLLTVLLGLGFLSEQAGIHPAIIAFVIGMVLSDVVEEHADVQQKLKGIVFSFFAPIFFFHAGIQVDVRAVDLGVLELTGVLLVVAGGLKYGATLLAARWLTNTLGHFAGLLFNYRLTFGLIAAAVGLEEQVLDQRLYSAVLLVVIISAAVPMLLLRHRPSEG